MKVYKNHLSLGKKQMEKYKNKLDKILKPMFQLMLQELIIFFQKILQMQIKMDLLMKLILSDHSLIW
jgi:hypothetical protein